MKKYYCFRCQKDVQPKHMLFRPICPECHVFLWNTEDRFFKICPHCGANMPVDASVCLQCQHPMSDANATREYAYDTYNTRDQYLFYSLIGLLLFLLCISAINCFYTSGPQMPLTQDRAVIHFNVDGNNVIIDEANKKLLEDKIRSIYQRERHPYMLLRSYIHQNQDIKKAENCIDSLRQYIIENIILINYIPRYISPLLVRTKQRIQNIKLMAPCQIYGNVCVWDAASKFEAEQPCAREVDLIYKKSDDNLYITTYNAEIQREENMVNTSESCTVTLGICTRFCDKLNAYFYYDVQSDKKYYFSWLEGYDKPLLNDEEYTDMIKFPCHRK